MKTKDAPGITFDMLADLRDALHARAANGVPLPVRDPGTDHGRALVLALGAAVVPIPREKHRF